MYNQGYRPQQQGTYPQQGPYSQQGVYPQQGGYPQQGAYPPQGNWYAPPPQQAASGSGRKRSGGSSQPPKKQGKKQRKKRSFKWQLIKLLIVLVVFAGGAGWLYVWKTQSDVLPYENVFLNNITVDGIDLSGKTWAEGSQLVWNQVNQKQNGWYVRLRNARGDYKDITAQTLGISFDPSAALEAAWAIGHDGSMNLFELRDEIERVNAGSHAFFSAEQSADTTPIDSILQTLESAAYRAPTDAYIISFNPDDTNNPFTYQHETYGQRLNTAAIREQILSMVQNLESGEIMLETEMIAPNVTVAQLSQTVALRNRAVTAISSSSTEERTENIRIAFSKINGMQLQDGEKFSFNNVVGRRNMDNGFLPAIEYAYGQEQWGWGGGVCQASTTVYLAAIQSGMTILKREPHSMAVSYTKLGMDATVSDTRGREIDFSFRNECGGTVYIAAHVIQSPTNKRKLMCEVRIYWPSLGNVRYELEAETVQVIEKPLQPTMKEDKDGTYVTYVDETKVIEGREGYVVDAYLVTYVDNTKVARDRVTTDTYPAKEDTVYIGVKQRTGGY